MQTGEAAKIERDLTSKNATSASPTEIASRDKPIKELEAQVSALSKSKGGMVNGKQVEPVDYSLMDSITAAQERRRENN